ncbi:hypothetical protein [Aquibium oceanicum]|nr:hypothetical protein [Aquibium oceanicum]
MDMSLATLVLLAVQTVLAGWMVYIMLKKDARDDYVAHRLLKRGDEDKG